MTKKLIPALILICAVALLCFLIYKHNNSKLDTTEQQINQPAAATTTTTKPPVAPKIVSPIENPSQRITKKFFGTYVTPKNSPVSPERFTGYHTGLDFETFADEQNTDVNINVICTGKLLKKARATGYGGYAVQACTIDNQDVTVVYGHLRQSSITPDVGDELQVGSPLGVLGTGYSAETDGERKHLHLSIHIGNGINIKGYVQSKTELAGWLDPQLVLGL